MLKFFAFFFSLTFVFGQVPKSPFGVQTKICPTANNKPYSVDNFPGTPFVIQPFVDNFVNPSVLMPTNRMCRDDGHCMITYNIDVFDTRIRPFDKSIKECIKHPPTWVLTYGGKVPGPTIIVPTGHESTVRFNNKISMRYFKQYNPCVAGRTGRPISIHLHGSASLAPFDGWAEDETCANESKDYIYPNNRATTAWYHDHALHITSNNAYFGLAGGYVISSKKKDGGCGEPWNLENIEDLLLILNDKVLDNKCQLYMDTFKVHKDDLYGDINTVSGIPFPNMNIQSKSYRLRIINTAVSRPYLVKIKNSKLQDIAPGICKIIAADGGYRAAPVDFPVHGLLIGVAERYDVVCDFSKLSGQTLFLWNDRDEKIMKGVPYFCYSHLLARMVVTGTPSSAMPNLDPSKDTSAAYNPLYKVLSQQDINEAMKIANEGKFHRRMDFGRSMSQWTINGETWDSFKIAASDIGQNTWELWMFQTGGGWFHPVHMHLVDFFLLRREGTRGIEMYEKESPKDIFYLGPSEKVWVIVRFGAHKGDYMFHCHNLRHEDDDMMRAMRIMDGGMTKSTASQFILNPLHKIIYNNWKYTDPMLGETGPKVTRTLKAVSLLTQENMNKNLYRIFYPKTSDRTLPGYTNPWEAKWCKIA